MADGPVVSEKINEKIIEQSRHRLAEIAPRLRDLMDSVLEGVSDIESPGIKESLTRIADMYNLCIALSAKFPPEEEFGGISIAVLASKLVLLQKKFPISDFEKT